MRTYRKKPVVIQAVQWTGENEVEVQDFLKLTDHAHVGYVKGSYVDIGTLEGVMVASIGDYIIKGVKGEFYPCKPDIFEMTYDPTSMVVVTRWGQGGAPWLILKGTPEETRAEAVQYFDDDLSSLKGTLEEMSQPDFDNLKEFQG